MAEPLEPVGGQRRPAAFEQRHQRRSLAPGSQHSVGSSPSGEPSATLVRPLPTLELQVEARVADLETRDQRRRQLEVVPARTGQGVLPTLEPRGEGHRLLGPALHPHPRRQAQLALQPVQELPLGLLVAQGHLAAQVDQPPGVDSGLRRIAVDQRGHRRELLPVPLGLDPHAGRQSDGVG